MIVSELYRRVWTTDPHGSRYILTWGKPDGWALGFDIRPPHNSGGNYSYKRLAPDQPALRHDYTHRSWSVELWFLWRGLYLARVKQTLVRVENEDG